VDEPTVGVLGGVGPAATVYFMQRVIDLTQAQRDQDHINMVVKQHATIPDRTAFLLGRSTSNPLPVMVEDARELQAAGATFIAMPCNTAHYFYDELQAAVDVPFVNIVDESISAAVAATPDLSLLGVLATDGTVRSGTYERACQRRGLECLIPVEAVQAEVMDIIYEGVKAGRPVPRMRLEAVIAHLRDRGCQAIVLGCTELSVLGHQLGVPGDVIDSLDVLARRTIELCGKNVVDQ
jgi:aspartate racemase